MKPARSTYCGECTKDFVPSEVVYYAWIENRSFCVNCHVKLKSKIKDWEARQVASNAIHDVATLIDKARELHRGIEVERRAIDNPALVRGILNELEFFIRNAGGGDGE